MDTDAHHPWQFEFIDLALAAALAAKIPPERIVNFMPLKELRAWVERFDGQKHAARARGRNDDVRQEDLGVADRNCETFLPRAIPSHLQRLANAN
jgi:hypothetical protein